MKKISAYPMEKFIEVSNQLAQMVSLLPDKARENVIVQINKTLAKPVNIKELLPQKTEGSVRAKRLARVIERIEKRAGEDKSATWSQKYHQLTYFSSRNTETTVECSNFVKAKKIVSNSGIPQILKIVARTQKVADKNTLEKALEIGDMVEKVKNMSPKEFGEAIIKEYNDDKKDPHSTGYFSAMNHSIYDYAKLEFGISKKSLYKYLEAAGYRKEGSSTQKVADKWESKPRGWDKGSMEKYWKSLTGDVEHKASKCIKRMEGIVDDPGAFCSSLRDKLEGGKKWREERKKRD